MPDIARKAGSQGRMKWGATGALVPGPPVQRTPRAETYCFKQNTRLNNFRGSEAIQECNSTIIFLCCV